MKRALFAMFAMGLASMANAQTADWSVPVDGTAKQVYFNSFTQTPVVETESKYVGVSTDTKSVAWTVEKSKLVAASKAASLVTGDAALQEYIEIPGTQFAAFRNVVMDVATGQVVLGDDNTAFSAFLSYDIVPEMNCVLFKVRTSDEVIAYCVDIETNKVLWGAKVGNYSAAGAALKGVTSFASGRDISMKNVQPCINADNNIVYVQGKSVYLINSKDGSVIWQNDDCFPGFVCTSNDNKYVFVVEKASGLKVGMGMGKKVNCLDAKTGKLAWPEVLKLDGPFVSMGFLSDDEAVIACAEGVQLYSVSTGKALWKKDFGAHSCNGIAILKEGLKVYYGDKMILIDPKTGLKIWKSPIKLDGVSEEAADVFQKDYSKSFVILTGQCFGVFNSADNKKKFTIDIADDDKVAFDDKNNKVVVVTGKKMYIVDPDNDAKCPEALKTKLDSPKELSGVYCSDKGQFVYGNHEYVMINTDRTVAGQKVYPVLKTGSKAGLVSLAYWMTPNSVMNAFTNVTGEHTYNVSYKLRKQLKANAKQKKAVRADDTRTVFLTGETAADGTDDVKLAVVDKTNGQELKVVQFSKDRSVVYTIDFDSNVVYFMENGKLNCLAL